MTNQNQASEDFIKSILQGKEKLPETHPGFAIMQEMLLILERIPSDKKDKTINVLAGYISNPTNAKLLEVGHIFAPSPPFTVEA